MSSRALLLSPPTVNHPRCPSTHGLGPTPPCPSHTLSLHDTTLCCHPHVLYIHFSTSPLHDHLHLLSSATVNPRHLLPTPPPSSSRPDTAAPIQIHSNVSQSCMSCCTHRRSGAGLTVLPVLRQALGDPVSRRAPILRRHQELPRGHHVVVAQRPAAGKPVSCSHGQVVTPQRAAARGQLWAPAGVETCQGTGGALLLSKLTDRPFKLAGLA